METNKEDECEYCGHPRDDHIKDATGKYKEVCINGATKGCFCLCKEFIDKIGDKPMNTIYMRTKEEILRDFDDEGNCGGKLSSEGAKLILEALLDIRSLLKKCHTLTP